ncbi:MAG: helix-turn-helix domain-containing protein, partial [Prosthecobacter sp.]
DEAWGLDFFPSSRALDMHISQLRRKIEADPVNPTIITTVRGAGYRFE